MEATSLRGVAQVWHPALVGPHGGPGVGAAQGARTAGVIEMDVGEDDVRQIVGADTELGERLHDHVVVGAGAGFHQGRFGGRHQVDGVELAARRS